ncbi:MAG: dihydrolipoamide acetyltransferase family protein [Anaerolineales bacterium]|nr:2-oxo acid dehydrogenase subunit E2 [Anaerolineales bacterium]MCS7248252.1 2-oxo acid dehydrogenase subunit E2 [Anaerolineales bacterium]MDW8162066.1 dihydrolipoamide acetyltransferase family protein [Anaerolineales bacterium]MDW8446244.1 dihydrolipoamide acetyltransferase family protein [Anaerolineales bacterium]
MATQVIMPQLGESVVEGTVTKWLKQKGEPVQEMEALLEVNTDKVDTEIPSPASGVLLDILVPEGSTVQAGTVLAWIGEPGEVLPQATAFTPPKEETESEVAQALVPTHPLQRLSAPQERELGFISPVVARMAKEYQIDLAQVRGTGQGGRITKKDLLAYLEKRQRELAPAETQTIWETPADGDLFRPTELIFGEASTPPLPPVPPSGRLIPFSALRKAIAEHMTASKRIAAHVTTVMEADLSRVVAHRKAHQAEFAQQGAKLTYTAYFAAATIAALKAYPIVNSSFTAEGIRIHPQINLGIATSLGEEGLIVPVIKDADSLSLLGLARAINDLAQRARSRQLKPDEVKGGTFTLSNHGVSGSLFATPIINQPQCAILGVGVIQKRVVVIEDELGSDILAIRPMVYLSLTFDHRILDGAAADAFLARVVEELEKFSD